MNYNIFGSSDSLDYDVMMFVDTIPSIQQSKIYCSQLEKIFPLKDKKVNINLAIVKDKIITKVYKGTPDECNNSIFYTYHLHQQQYPKAITKILTRNVELKIARVLRIILSFISRTEFRKQVKIALKSNAQIKIETLKLIKLNTISEFNKNNQDIKDVTKQIAFQIAQALLLIDNIEVYSKDECCRYFPDLSLFLMREKSDMLMLDKYKDILLDTIVQKYDLVKIKE